MTTGTNYSTAGSNQTTSTVGPVTGRPMVIGLLLVVVIAWVVWMEVSAWRQMARLEATFAEARRVSFLTGIRLREGMEQLTAGLLRFQLSGDPDERERFHEVARDLTERLSQPALLTSEERALAREAARALEVFLRGTSELLEEAVTSVRKSTAEEVHREIQSKAGPVYEAADRLANAQEHAAGGFFAGAEQSLASLRHWFLASLLMMILLIGVIMGLVYRAWVAPLRAQLSESRSVIDRQEHLASLGILAAGVAHEIRNPLAALKFRLFSLKKSLPSTFSEHEDLAVIHTELQRLDRILNDFIQFARPAEPVLKEVSILPLLETVRNLLKDELLERNIRIDCVSGDFPTIRVDRDQLQQALINLVHNAADAVHRDGVITLSVRQGMARLSRRPEPVTLLDVSDTGKGISAEDEKRIFDPFFSTKEGGTGLGLPIAARMVEKNGGYLEYTSQRGGGTTFRIVLPRSMDDESKIIVD